MPLAATRSELLKKRADQFKRVLHAVEKGDIRALHQARVASRRIRELIPVLQIGSTAARKLGRRLRKVTARLGSVRELDVLVLLIGELHVSGRRAHGGLGRVGVRVAKSRDQARKKLLGRLPLAELARLARKLDRLAARLKESERASSKGAARSWRWGIDARVVKRASRVSTALADAGALYLPERLHRVRLAVKKLRYAMELATEAAGQSGGADLRLLKRSQDLLGRMHDLQMLIDEARKTQASLAPPSLAVWRDLDTLVASLEDDCRRLHARFMALHDALADLARRQSDQTPSILARAPSRRAG